VRTDDPGRPLLASLRDAQALGLILLGFGAPVRVLQTRDDVENVFHIAVVAAVCKQRSER